MSNSTFVRTYAGWNIFRNHKLGKFFGHQPHNDDSTSDYDSIDDVIAEIDYKPEDEHDFAAYEYRQ